MHRCSFGEGVTIKPDGVNELDPCLYEDIAVYKNVTVTISQCKRCGKIDVSWKRQPDTERVDKKEDENEQE